MSWEEFSGWPEYHRQQTLQNRRAAGRCQDQNQQHAHYGPAYTQKGCSRNQGPYSSGSKDGTQKGRVPYSSGSEDEHRSGSDYQQAAGSSYGKHGSVG